MCKFFSFVGDGFGNYLYSDWQDRQNKTFEPDSHTAILTRNKVSPNRQDKWSKYEYNPLMKKFTIDEPVDWHNHEAARNWVESLNFKNVVPELVIKPIINPLQGKAKKVSKKEIELLTQWSSVWASTRNSIGVNVWDSVWNSVGKSVRESIWDSVRDSVGASVLNYIMNSVEAYYSSFFDIQYKYDFSSCIKLWESGFVSSFNGKTWRLHSGKNAEVVYEWTKE